MKPSVPVLADALKEKLAWAPERCWQVAEDILDRWYDESHLRWRVWRNWSPETIGQYSYWVIRGEKLYEVFSSIDEAEARTIATVLNHLEETK